jgi:hypothetical protein
MLVFPTYEGHRTLAVMQPAETLRPSYSAACGNQAFPHPIYGAACMEILQNRVFTEENTTSSLRKSSSPFFL